jgi:hypothetical protein
MLSVTSKPFMQNVVMPSVVMQNVVAPSYPEETGLKEFRDAIDSIITKRRWKDNNTLSLMEQHIFAF